MAEPLTCASANSESSSSTSWWRAQSLKLDRKPWPEAAIPAWRSACVITLSPSIAPGREPGNTGPPPRRSARASRSTSSAWFDSGTRCALPVFIDSAGFTHTAASMSNCSQVAQRTSIWRAAVSAVNRIARFVEGAQWVASIFASAAATSEK